jgi:hypothetical protein
VLSIRHQQQSCISLTTTNRRIFAKAFSPNFDGIANESSDSEMLPAGSVQRTLMTRPFLKKREGSFMISYPIQYKHSLVLRCLKFNAYGYLIFSSFQVEQWSLRLGGHDLSFVHLDSCFGPLRQKFPFGLHFQRLLRD